MYTKGEIPRYHLYSPRPVFHRLRQSLPVFNGFHPGTATIALTAPAQKLPSILAFPKLPFSPLDSSLWRDPGCTPLLHCLLRYLDNHSKNVGECQEVLLSFWLNL